MRVVEESRIICKVLGDLSTFVTFIPKKNYLEAFEYYRPTSLCNSIYTIIDTIANRINRVFSEAIFHE